MGYQPINFNLTEKQIKKIQDAKAKHISVTISIAKDQINKGDHTLYIINSQQKNYQILKLKA